VAPIRRQVKKMIFLAGNFDPRDSAWGRFYKTVLAFEALHMSTFVNPDVTLPQWLRCWGYT
jgi:hypothetical protein